MRFLLWRHFNPRPDQDHLWKGKKIQYFAIKRRGGLPNTKMELSETLMHMVYTNMCNNIRFDLWIQCLRNIKVHLCPPKRTVRATDWVVGKFPNIVIQFGNLIHVRLLNNKVKSQIVSQIVSLARGMLNHSV